MAKLHIITLCARPQLLPSIIMSMMTAEPHGLYLEWHIGFKSPEPDNRGMDRCNKLIDIIDEGWIGFIPDDSRFHPKVFKRVEETINANPNAQAIVVSQERHDVFGYLHAKPENMKPMHVDATQYFLKREIIGDIRLISDKKYLRVNDGYFIEEIYKKSPDKFVFLDETLAEFNSTFWVPGEKPVFTNSQTERRIMFQKNFCKDNKHSNHEADTVSDVELCNH